MNLLALIRRHATLSGLNAVFTGCCFLLPSVAGAVASVIFNGGGIWSVGVAASRPRKFHLNRPMMAQTVAIYAYCASYFLSSAINNSFPTDASKLVSFVTFLFFPFSYVSWSISEKTSLARIAIWSSAAACCGAVIIAAIQVYGFGMRAEGGAGNAIVFATVVCLAIMVCLAGAMSGIVTSRTMLPLAALAGTVAILYSGTRVMRVALPVTGFVLLLIYRRVFTGSIFVRLLLAVAAIVAVCTVFGFQIIATRFGAALNDISGLNAGTNYDTAIGLRVALWHVGLDAFHQAPIFGHGAGATKILIESGMLGKFELERGFSHFHNGFLTALVESGIVGALSLASIFVVATANAARVLRTRTDMVERFGASLIIIAVIVYLLGGLTGILLGHDILDSVLMIFLIVGTYLACGRMADPIKGVAAREPGTKRASR